MTIFEPFTVGKERSTLVSLGHMTALELGGGTLSFTVLLGSCELGRMQAVDKQHNLLHLVLCCIFLLRNVLLTKLIPSGCSSIPILFCQPVRIFS